MEPVVDPVVDQFNIHSIMYQCTLLQKMLFPYLVQFSTVLITKFVMLPVYHSYVAMVTSIVDSCWIDC